MQNSHNLVPLNNILHSSKHKLTFISNPKVACSTIKNSLLEGFDGDVHAEANKKFNLPKDTEHDFFCLTRNPYSRTLSCFKNKIGPNKEKIQMLYGILFASDLGLKEIYSRHLRILKALSKMTIHLRWICTTDVNTLIYTF